MVTALAWPGTCGSHAGHMWVTPCGSHAGHMWVTRRAHVGHTPGTCGSHAGHMWGTRRAHVGHTPGTCGSHAGHMWVTRRAHVGQVSIVCFRCRQTLLQLHEDATNRIRQSQLTELERVQGEHQAQVSRLL